MEKTNTNHIEISEKHHILITKTIYIKDCDMVYKDGKCWKVVRYYDNEEGVRILDLIRPIDGGIGNEISSVESYEVSLITHSSLPIEEYVNDIYCYDLRFDRVKFMPVLGKDKINIIKVFCEDLIKANTNDQPWSSPFCSALHAVIGRINSLEK